MSKNLSDCYPTYDKAIKLSEAADSFFAGFPKVGFFIGQVLGRWGYCSQTFWFNTNLCLLKFQLNTKAPIVYCQCCTFVLYKVISYGIPFE